MYIETTGLLLLYIVCLCPDQLSRRVVCRPAAALLLPHPTARATLSPCRISAMRGRKPNLELQPRHPPALLPAPEQVT